MKHGKSFTQKLLYWHSHDNDRQMPWKEERDPYKIWISEIILQQTRVKYATAYYEHFISAFPDIPTLATAPEEKVYKMWEGLGYYSRCRNIIKTARHLYLENDAQFPTSYVEILALKGIGPYTAAAISSFAFGLPYAVVDGNVIRVLSRCFGLRVSGQTTTGKAVYTATAQSLLGDDPAKYNQAIMDFGAVICTPAKPACHACPMQGKCIAFQNDLVAELPLKQVKPALKERFFNYIQFEYKNTQYVKKRTEADIWQNLYEFFLIETPELLETRDLHTYPAFLEVCGAVPFMIQEVSRVYSQKLTHQLIRGKFFRILVDQPLAGLENFEKADMDLLRQLPFPKIITSYLRD